MILTQRSEYHLIMRPAACTWMACGRARLHGHCTPLSHTHWTSISALPWYQYNSTTQNTHLSLGSHIDNTPIWLKYPLCVLGIIYCPVQPGHNTLSTEHNLTSKHTLNKINNWQSQMFWNTECTVTSQGECRSARFHKEREPGGGRQAVWICGQNALFE